MTSLSRAVGAGLVPPPGPRYNCGWKMMDRCWKPFKDTRGNNPAGAILTSTKRGGKRAPGLTTITNFRGSKGQNLLRSIMSMKQRLAWYTFSVALTAIPLGFCIQA